MIDFIKLGICNIKRKKLRSFLTMIGISIGVCSVIIIGTVGELGKTTINSELKSIGLESLTVSKSEDNYVSTLSQTELELIDDLPAVEACLPILLYYTLLNAKEDVLEKCAVWGVNESISEVFSLETIFGRNLNQNDLSLKSDVCLIDENYANLLYKRSNVVGKKISLLINGAYREFEVVGVVNAQNSMLKSLITEFAPTFIYVPFSSMQKYRNTSYFEQIAVKVREGFDYEKTGETILNTVERSTRQEGDYVIGNVSKEKEQLDSILNIITIILSAIASISLLVAGLSIMTVMLVSVSERTKEIGIKKSIGATKGIIVVEFLIEAFLLSLLGCIVGCVGGIVLSVIACFLLGQAVIINMGLLLFCVVFSMAVGTIFGVYPAIKAASLEPVDALRSF